MLNQREDKIIQYLSGNLTEQEQLAFLSELENNESMKALFEEYSAIWQLTNQLNYPSEDTIQAWDSFQQIVKAPIRILGFDWLKLAASILLLAAFSVGLWYVTSSPISSYSSKNEVQKNILEDNSIIVLNSNSTLTLGKSFNDKSREVWLEGEAHFEVAKSSKPFIVHTKNGDIEVLGTRFDVLTDPDRQFMMTELYEGSIQYNFDGRVEILKPGQLILKLGKNVEVLESNNVERMWDNSIQCKNSSLAYILSEIKLKYNVDYEVKSKYLKEHYTVSLPTDDLQSCLSILSTLSGKKFVLKDNVIVLE
ncbi:MAG: hypothetical protein RLZZ337_958 [Bacteroidota bacterium]|jgi:ferric-dicitrate binding protein FerR (iron transport regulator)